MKLVSVKDVLQPEKGVAARFEGEGNMTLTVFIPHRSWAMLRKVKRGSIPLLDDLRDTYKRGKR